MATLTTPKRKMRINLTLRQINYYACKYNRDKCTQKYRDGECKLIKKIEAAKERGYMKHCDLKFVGSWKWRGTVTRDLCDKNVPETVEERSAASFAGDCDRIRIDELLALRGVGYPMASVILHFAFPERYPIMDIRTMRTVTGSKHVSRYYNFAIWQQYSEQCRRAASIHNVKMRILDKALWELNGDPPDANPASCV